MAARVDKHADELIEALINSTEGKTGGKDSRTDDWGGYERLLLPGINHYICKDQTKRFERTNGIVHQQTGRWHRRQNKCGKLWAQTNVSTRLIMNLSH